MRKFVTAALFAATAAVPAFAQDAAPPQDAAPFTGPRIEGVIGYDTVSGQGADGRDGLAYGAQIGYDFQLGGAVLGVEGEITDSTTKARATDVDVAGDRLRIAAGRDLYVGARAGVAVSPNALVYAKAGYTNGRVKARYTAGNTTVRDSTDLDGFRVGAGVEQKLGGQTYVKGEYRYSNYEQDIDRHQVVAGVGVRF